MESEVRSAEGGHEFFEALTSQTSEVNIGF